VTATPLQAARSLHAQGHTPTLLLSARREPFGARSLLCCEPEQRVTVPPGSGAGLPAIPPRLVHGAHGSGLWVGAAAYDAGLPLLGITSRHVSDVPALVAAHHASYAAYDHDTGRWTLVGPPTPARELLEAAVAEPGPSRSAVRSRPGRPEAR
jgi:transposase